MKIAVAQMNTTIGDFEGNAQKILQHLSWAEGAGADLIVFPELAVCGYPPGDLLYHPGFIDRTIQTVEQIASKTTSTGILLGFVSRNPNKAGKPLFNSAALLAEGRVQSVQHKTLLPTYDVFDEIRYFEAAPRLQVYDFKGMKLGISICEDIWSYFIKRGRRLYDEDPIAKLASLGADIIFNLSASPFTLGKQAIRESLICDAARRHGKPVVYCNLVGGNDQLIFDGHSFIVDEKGEIIHEGQRFVEDNFLIDMEKPKRSIRLKPFSDEEQVHEALVLGLRDYMEKCQFDHVVLGVSGGIDSAVVATLAAEAAGPQNVTAILMPSPYTPQESMSLGKELVQNLSVQREVKDISEIYNSYLRGLGLSQEESEISKAHENLQARIRGNIIMAFSNQTGALVLSTGNKSELSVGYCTLYGDMAGGLGVISDVPKTMVYALARHLNEEGEIIPQRIIDRPPSAELKPNQTDQDSLPPYEILDVVLKAYIEDQVSIREIAALGFDTEMVATVTRLVDRNEYKRRQAALGLKVTSKAFGTGRRFPIAWKS